MVRTPSCDVLCNNNGEWWVDWLINSVTVIGPRHDLERFKALCIVSEHDGHDGKTSFLLERLIPTPHGLDENEQAYWRNDNWGTDREPWNVEVVPQSDPWSLSFKFESGGGFPEPVFKLLAEHFPRLAFECFSLESGNLYMEIGWFNPPLGCSEFHEVEEDDVPANCTDWGPPRDTVAELRRHAFLGRLKRAAQEMEGDPPQT